MKKAKIKKNPLEAKITQQKLLEAIEFEFSAITPLAKTKLIRQTIADFTIIQNQAKDNLNATNPQVCKIICANFDKYINEIISDSNSKYLFYSGCYYSVKPYETKIADYLNIQRGLANLQKDMKLKV